MLEVVYWSEGEREGEKEREKVIFETHEERLKICLFVGGLFEHAREELKH